MVAAVQENASAPDFRKSYAAYMLRVKHLTSTMLAFTNKLTSQCSDDAPYYEHIAQDMAKLNKAVDGSLYELATVDFMPTPDALKEMELWIAWREAALIPLVEIDGIRAYPVWAHKDHENRDACKKLCSEYLQAAPRLLKGIELVCSDKWFGFISLAEHTALKDKLNPIHVQVKAIVGCMAKEVGKPTVTMPSEKLWKLHVEMSTISRAFSVHVLTALGSINKSMAKEKSQHCLPNSQPSEPGCADASMIGKTKKTLH